MSELAALPWFRILCGVAAALLIGDALRAQITGESVIDGKLRQLRHQPLIFVSAQIVRGGFALFCGLIAAGLLSPGFQEVP